MFSDTLTFYKGEWLEGNPPILGPRSHAFWQASSVFDGGRIFNGVMPDVDLHAARLNRSAPVLGLKATQTIEEMVAQTREGAKRFEKRFGKDKALYVRPMYWGVGDGPSSIIPDPETTEYSLCLYEAPMPEPKGLSITLSPFRRPTPECAPTESKAGCLYPNNSRALRLAREQGFDNCLVADMLGNIAETSSSNIFCVKEGVVFTPIPNGTFLNGITRQRTIKLLRAQGIEVIEKSLTYKDFQEADEIFSSGNYSKIVPITRIDERNLQQGNMYKIARETYMDFASGFRV